MNTDYDVLIAGGGMVGATLACALGGSSLKVGVIEPQIALPVQDGQDLRVSAITPASQAVFDNLGVWAGVNSSRCGIIEAMHIWEGDSVLNFDSADIGEPCLAWIVENRLLVTALLERLEQFSNITLFCPATLGGVEIEAKAVTVNLADGRRLRATVLVGADGADSQVRRAVGMEWTRHDLGQTAIVATVRAERPHVRTARQHFLTTGPLALLPLAEPNSLSIVWSADTDRARGLMALDDAAFTRQLQTAFGDSLGALELVSERVAIALALGFARDYSTQRVALVGDAAHTLHPLAGQGVNLGILDAATLAETLLAAAAQQRDLGAYALLRRYERARKGADLGMQALTGGLRYLFGSNLAAAKRLRTAGMRLNERLPAIKNYLMRQASGVSGEIPKLAQRRLS